MTEWIFAASPWFGPAYHKCMASTAPVTHQNRSYCVAVPFMYPYVEAPLFVSENTADSYQIFTGGGCPRTESAEVNLQAIARTANMACCSWRCLSHLLHRPRILRYTLLLSYLA
jgi:hypothetical protein